MVEQENIKNALESIFSGISKLHNEFPERKFTIDGRLVGDIGEIIAALKYDIVLDEKSKPGHDGTTSKEQRVQVKATFQDALTFKTTSGYYLGLKLNKDGESEEIFNGPAEVIFKAYSHRNGIGEKLLRFPNKRLKELSEQIPEKDKIKKRKN